MNAIGRRGDGTVRHTTGDDMTGARCESLIGVGSVPGIGGERGIETGIEIEIDPEMTPGGGARKATEVERGRVETRQGCAGVARRGRRKEGMDPKGECVYSTWRMYCLRGRRSAGRGIAVGKANFDK